MKSTVEQIRRRFDRDVERFSNLDAGQTSTIDAALTLELIATAAARNNPDATGLLDVGCGAGNFSLKLLQQLPDLNVTLIDLSRPMLDRAVARLSGATAGQIATHQGDIRELELGEAQYDLIVAAAVLHHLRTDAEWEAVFASFYRALRPGGSLWISDLIEHDIPAVGAVMWERYGDYLTQLKGEAYREQVFAYIDEEDSPRPLIFQLNLLQQVGFQKIDVLHKNSCFAAFGAIKPPGKGE